MNSDELRGKADEIAALLMSPLGLGALKDVDLTALLGRADNVADDSLRAFLGPSPVQQLSATPSYDMSGLGMNGMGGLGAMGGMNALSFAGNPMFGLTNAFAAGAAQRLMGQRMAELAESLSRTPYVSESVSKSAAAARGGKGMAAIAPKHTPMQASSGVPCLAVSANLASPVPSDDGVPVSPSIADSEDTCVAPRGGDYAGSRGGMKRRQSECDGEAVTASKRQRFDSDAASVDDGSDGSKECVSEEEKRRRNCVASARFRQKKKKELRQLEDIAQQKTEECDKLHVRVRTLEQELNYLRSIVSLCTAVPKFGGLGAPFMGFAV
eukprot:Opistho-2@22508